MRTHPPPVEFVKPPDGLNGFRFPINDKAGHAVIDHFRYRAGPERDNRRAARHRFDHHQTERLGPVDRKQQSRGTREEFLLGCVPVSIEDFVVGWISTNPYWGRPAGLLVMPDGALLISDDASGRIWRASYGP